MRNFIIALLSIILPVCASADGTTVMIGFGSGGGGGGSPPTATTITGTNSATNVSTVSVNLPASISSGEVLYNVATFAAGTVTGYDLGTAAEYTETTDNNGSMGYGTAYKVATGSEGSSATATWASSTSRVSTVTAKFAGTTDTAPACGTASFVTSANPDPPSVSFSAPATIFTWVNIDASATTVSADPSGYGYSCVEASANGTRTRMCMCQASSGTDCSSGDPGTWTLSVSTLAAVQTCAIEDN